MNAQTTAPPSSKPRPSKPRSVGFAAVLFEKKDQQALADQCLLTRRATIESIKAQNPDPSLELVKRVEDMLNAAAGTWEEKWEIAYEIEQHLVILYDPTSLEVELRRRLIELKDKFGSEMA